MAETYTKLFRSMLLSSVWSESNATRILWVTLLAEADADGRVYASIPGLATLAHLTIDEVESALQVLQSPDRYSKTPDQEGRRVVEFDGGFELVNHAKYREKMDSDDRKRKAADRARRYRERQKSVDTVTPERDGSVTECDARDDVRKVRHTDGDADADADANAENNTQTHTPAKSAATSSLARVWFDEFWSVVHLKIGKQNAFRAFGRAIKQKCKNDDVTQRDAKDAIVSAMTEFASSPAAAPTDHSPIHPATWLNQGRYDDDRATWQGNGSTKNQGFKW